MLGPFCQKHFTLKQFYPVHDDPHTFIYSQWQRDKSKPNLLYLTYRTIMALLFLVTWLITIFRESEGGIWPIFLTNWGYTVCTTQAVMAFGILATYVLAPRFKKLPNLRENTLKAYPVYWVLYTIATPLAFGITFMYWVVIYDAKKMTFDAMNYFVHGNNSIMMMIDLWIVSQPTRILHFVYPAVLGIMYTIFSIIYYVEGGTTKDGSKCIYKILDWEKPMPTALTCLGVTVFLILLHLVVFLIYKVRITLYERCFSSKQDTPSGLTETKRQAAYVNEGMSHDVV
ncbi:protein rolling stone-like [Anoplophora glabripennis]|uniref:protein rolling stone-like n=1 Tax=Anoplophora glabripennis TaxID=217634 RepID=UPI0008739C9E|nr:protein rolling stone-like [Anoplophora glabripennis]XP_018568782.1 protein rolling stone-like [Anoplophora glabripennis]XP_018568789.1 protein rolling stone-like [Anoplophora glabripennis]XP_018568796.1 protein rolling stone-like [Anoplophora glabripennis]